MLQLAPEGDDSAETCVGTDKKSQEEYAIKIMEVAPVGQDVGGNDNTWADVIAEVSILCRLDHPNIISLREFFIQSNKVYLVTNLVKGASLLLRCTGKKMCVSLSAIVLLCCRRQADMKLHSNNENKLLSRHGLLLQGVTTGTGYLWVPRSWFRSSKAAECGAGGELLESVLQRGSYSEATAHSCFQQLLEGVRYCHSHGVVHRDLKLENLLLEKEHELSRILIVDFGLAKGHFQVAPMAMDTVCGTPHYVAPEVIQVRSMHLSLQVGSCGLLCA